MSFGENMKRIRKEKGMSQSVLGDKLGVTQQTIAQYEKIQNTPKYETLKKIADALEVSTLLLTAPYPRKTINTANLFSGSSNPMNSKSITETLDLAKLTNNKDNNIYIDQNLQKLYEVAIEKAIHHEELTEEEKQVIIGIPGELQQKGNSYENSYSFASSEEEFEKLLGQRKEQKEKTLLADYRKLNEIGKSEAIKRISELTEIPRYIKSDEPPQD